MPSQSIIPINIVMCPKHFTTTILLQNVEALVRPSSAEKPAVKALAGRGVQIRVGDTTGPIEDLVGLLAEVDVLISAIDPGSLLAQIQLATAAKEAGVKRFVPCAFTVHDGYSTGWGDETTR
jgi:hypothetical protein